MTLLVRTAVLCLVAFLGSLSADAEVPFYTDDTGVTGIGTMHVELSDEHDVLQSGHYPDLRQNTANAKVNIGLPHGFEFDIDVPYITIFRSAAAPGSHGVGDTNLGLKWQIRGATPDRHLPALAVSFYTEFPTGDFRRELGSGVQDYWLNLIAQAPVSDITHCNVNLGILFAGNTSTGVVGIETTRGRVYTGGLSLLHDVNDRLIFGAEVYGGIATSNGLDRTQLQTMLGAQYAIRDGLAIYVGLVAGTFTASPRLGGQIGIAMDFPQAFDALNRVLFRHRDTS